MSKQGILERIVGERLGGRVVGARDVGEGRPGRVFAVRVESRGSVATCCVKLERFRPDPDFAAEPVDDRVYGPRSDNLPGARQLIERAGLPLPRLLSRGVLDGVRFQIMEFVPGVSIRDHLRTHDPESEALHELAGEVLARLHRTRRGYPGWVDLPPSLAWDWTEAFFASASRRIAEAVERRPRLAGVAVRLHELLGRARADWRAPEAFVFSHPDGIQGLADHDGRRWELCAMVDAEDHHFTDPRFVLTGYELAHGTPSAFRGAYLASGGEWPEGLAECRDVYQLYFLSTWVTVLEPFEGAASLCRSIEDQIASLVLDPSGWPGTTRFPATALR